MHTNQQNVEPIKKGMPLQDQYDRASLLVPTSPKTAELRARFNLDKPADTDLPIEPHTS